MGAKTQAAVALALSWVIASRTLWFSFNVENGPVYWRHGHAEANHDYDTQVFGHHFQGQAPFAPAPVEAQLENGQEAALVINSLCTCVLLGASALLLLHGFFVLWKTAAGLMPVVAEDIRPDLEMRLPLHFVKLRAAIRGWPVRRQLAGRRQELRATKQCL